jgi:hypothetical protein
MVGRLGGEATQAKRLGRDERWRPEETSFDSRITEVVSAQPLFERAIPQAKA